MAPLRSTAIEVARCQDSVEFVRFEFLCGHEGRENEDMIKGTMQHISRGRQVNVLLRSLLNIVSRKIVMSTLLSLHTFVAASIERRVLFFWR